MKDNKVLSYPSFINRITGVWYRHYRIYTKNIFSNGLPPFLEPLIFLAGIGLGLNKYILNMDGIPYLKYLSTGLLVTTAMYTASFECTFGTFIRMEFDKVYDGMLAAPLNVRDLFIGEILWSATKGFFFSLAVVAVIVFFGILGIEQCLIAPLVGFLTGAMFASVSLFVTSYVKDINQFNFYFSGLLSPMFFFSGVVFPINNLPKILWPFAELMPLTHSVKLIRAASFNEWSIAALFSALYILAFTFIVGAVAISRLRRRLVK